MLRKLSHIILAVLLLVSTMGLAVSRHYCGGRLVSVSLFDEPEICCNMAGCCHNETTFYQVKEDFSAPQLVNIPLQVHFDVFGFELLNELQNTIPVVENEVFQFNEEPPPQTIQKSLSIRQSYLL